MGLLGGLIDNNTAFSVIYRLFPWMDILRILDPAVETDRIWIHPTEITLPGSDPQEKTVSDLQEKRDPDPQR